MQYTPKKHVDGPNNDFYDLKESYFRTAADGKDPNRHNILGAERLVFHYCLFANHQVAEKLPMVLVKS